MKAYVIECRTGCSCCSGDNHYRGPYSSKEVADRKAQSFHDARLLASQYAPNGRYHVTEHEAEQLPDGRVIVGRTVFNGFADNADDDYISQDWASY